MIICRLPKNSADRKTSKTPNKNCEYWVEIFENGLHMNKTPIKVKIIETKWNTLSFSLRIILDKIAVMIRLECPIEDASEGGMKSRPK